MYEKDLKDFFPNTTQKPNFIFDVIMKKCGKENPHAYLVLDAIVRKTYGWWKEVDAIANSQLIEMTGLSEQTIRRSIKWLLKNKIIGRPQVGSGRKISKYSVTIYEYAKINKLEVPNGNPLKEEVPNNMVRDTQQEPYKVSNVDPQKKENKISKEITESIVSLPIQLKEFAKNNNLVYEHNTREDQKAQSKFVTELSQTNEQILTQVERLKPILKDSACDWWTKTNSFGFNFLLKNWGRIEAWHNAHKPQVREFKKPEPKAKPIFAANELDAMERFLK